MTAGWRLVPEKATPAMLQAAGYRASAVGLSTTGQEAWMAFLAAAPQPDQADICGPITQDLMKVLRDHTDEMNVMQATINAKRDAALEEAAALCDAWAAADVPGAPKGRSIRLAGAIRELKTKPHNKE